MKTQTAIILASLLAFSSAAPVDTAADDACDFEPTPSCTVIVTTVPATDVPTVIATIPSPTVTTTPVVDGNNVQTFTGTLGGPAPPVISGTGARPFTVAPDTFTGIAAALGRSCDKQHNACANAANSGQLAGGVGQCDTQNNECRALIASAAKKLRRRQQQGGGAGALDLGTCSDASIVFAEGLDGRTTPAFVAANQQDFNHGSAQNIGIIAGFICQHLGSPCGAPAEVQASCASASAAAVAAPQDQSAADAFNAVMAGGAAPAPVQTAPPAAGGDVVPTGTPDLVATPTAGSVVMTITSCV